MLLAEMTAIPFNWLPAEPEFGLETALQPVPFQCSISARSVVPLLSEKSPTAQTLLAEMAATPLRKLFPDPTFGLLTTFQVLPFQCSIRVLAVLLLLMS